MPTVNRSTQEQSPLKTITKTIAVKLLDGSIYYYPFQVQTDGKTTTTTATIGQLRDFIVHKIPPKSEIYHSYEETSSGKYSYVPKKWKFGLSFIMGIKNYTGNGNIKVVNKIFYPSDQVTLDWFIGKVLDVYEYK